MMIRINKRGIPALIVLALIVVTSSHAQGTMTDPRDGRVYKTIDIGTKTWMAENLNTADTAFFKLCYDDTELFCERYGGLYTWENARKACPAGWHLPSKEEYDDLMLLAGDDKKSRYKNLLENGTTGLNLMLGGWLINKRLPRFDGLTKVGFYWASTQGKIQQEGYRVVLTLLKTTGVSMGGKNDFCSVRCVKD